MAAPLLSTRRFLPLFLTQALGALNDNLFKSALVVLIAFRDESGGAALVALAGGLFILPYLLVSATAGQLADRFEKTRLIRLTKLFEVALMLMAAAGLLSDNVGLMLAVLFGLGVQAAAFGPLKYGILPERLGADELLRGNALVEAGTFAAILVGTIAGGALIGLTNGPALVAGAGIAVAVAGLLAALAIPVGEPAAPSLAIDRNPAVATWRLVRAARLNRPVWVALLALSWFWTLGATYLAQFPVLAKVEFAADNRIVTLLLASFTAGIGMGSLLVGRLAGSREAGSLAPVAAGLLTLFTWGFAALVSLPAASAWHEPAAMATSLPGLAALLCLVGAAACGGVYSVPLYAILQRRAPRAERARVVAANNVMNAVFMVLGSVVIAVIARAGWRPAVILGIAGALNAAAGLALRRALRTGPVEAGAKLGHEQV